MSFRRNYLSINNSNGIPRSSRHLFIRKIPNGINEEQKNEEFINDDEIVPLANNSNFQKKKNSPKKKIPISNPSLEVEIYDNKKEISLDLYKLFIEKNMTKSSINGVINLFRKTNPKFDLPPSIDKIIDFLSDNSKHPLKHECFEFCHSCNIVKISTSNSNNRCLECRSLTSKFYKLKLISLERGEIMDINNKPQLIKFFLLFSVLDKPARALMLNMKQFNGQYGCSKCYQPGESIRTVKNGHLRVYPYKNFNPEGPLRSQ
ncbi:hypothetical protein BpHYR1_000801, partial [Brachionus plicatilis]